MRTLVRTGYWSVGLVAALALVAVGSATVGPVDVGAATVGKVALNALVVPTDVALSTRPVAVAGATAPAPTVDVEFASPFRFPVDRVDAAIVMTARLPRIALGAVVGFALAAAGTVMQGFFRNPMADPSIVGVSSGAAVGAVATIAMPGSLPFGLGLQAAAFLGALCAGFGVYLIASEGGRTPVATLLLSGVAVQTLLGAVVSYLLLESGESLERAVYWLMGHLQYAAWEDVTVAAVVVPLLFGVLLAYTRDLNALLLGEEDAHGLGVDVERTKKVLLAASSVVTAAAVAVTGVIGFVGLIVPHTMRLLVGPDHRILLPTSALAGASFLVAADTVARAGPEQLPVGVVTAAVGAPFFLYLLRRREVHAL